MDNITSRVIIGLAAIVDKYGNQLSKLVSEYNENQSTDQIHSPIKQSMQAAMKMIGELATSYQHLSKETVSLTSRENEPDSLLSKWKGLLEELAQNNFTAMNAFHDCVVDTIRQSNSAFKPEDAAKVQQEASRWTQSNRAAVNSTGALLRDLGQLENKFSSWIWKSSSILADENTPANDALYKLAMQLSEGHASLGACLSADSHEIVTMNQDVIQNESQALSALKFAAESSSESSIVLDILQSLQNRRHHGIESAYIRLAQSRLALYSSLKASVNGECESVESSQTDDAVEPIKEPQEELGLKINDPEQDDTPDLGIEVNAEESIISSYSCAILKKGFPVHGRLSLTRSCLTFSSPLLSGNISISFTSLLDVRKERLGRMLPYCLKLTEATSVTTFTSFMYLDQAVAAIEELWKIQKAIAVAVMSPKQGMPFSFKEIVSNDESEKEAEPELSSGLELNLTEDKAESEPIPSKVLELLPQAHVAASLMTESPGKFTNVLSLSTLPIASENLIEHISNPACWKRFLERDGHVDINISEWVQDAETNTLIRTVHSKRPLGNVYQAFGVDSAMLKSTHRLGRQSDSVFVLSAETECTGIPYSDCFTVFVQMEISSSKQTSALNIGSEARFLKRTLLKGTIQKNVTRESQDSFKLFFTILKESLPELAKDSTFALANSQPQPIVPASPKKKTQYRVHRNVQALSNLIIATLFIFIIWYLIVGQIKGDDRKVESNIDAVLREVQDISKRLIAIERTLNLRK